MSLQVTSKNSKKSEISDILYEGISPSEVDAEKLKRGCAKDLSMEEAIRKSRALIEALPYIQSFKGKVVVVKFGGSAMVNIKTFQSILQDVVFMKTIGMMPVIVYGGGPHISSEMEKRGKKPLFIHGYQIGRAHV